PSEKAEPHSARARWGTTGGHGPAQARPAPRRAEPAASATRPMIGPVAGLASLSILQLAERIAQDSVIGVLFDSAPEHRLCFGCLVERDVHLRQAQVDVPTSDQTAAIGV